MEIERLNLAGYGAELFAAVVLLTRDQRCLRLWPTTSKRGNNFITQNSGKRAQMAERGCAGGFWDIITNSADAYLEKGLRHLPSPEEGSRLNDTKVLWHK